MKLEFYPVDVNYTIKDGKAVIQVFARTVDGQQVCLEDCNFEPYFTITGNPDLKELGELNKDGSRVVRVEKVKKNINEQPAEVCHVFVNVPKAVPVLKNAVREIPGVNEVYEYDILFTRRYLIDKKIRPLVKTAADVEEIASSLKVPCYSVRKIWQDSEDTIEEPRILAVDIETYNPDNAVNPKKNPIIMIGIYSKDFSRVITWKKFPSSEKFIEFVSSEADMIERFKELVSEYMPDMVTGYFTDGFDFPYLIARAKINKVKLDLGLDSSVIELHGRAEKEARIAGIAHLDIFKFIRKVVGRSLQTDSYSLNAVSKELLGEEKIEVDMQDMFKSWDNPCKKLEKFAKYNLQDCKLTYDLTMKLFPSLVEFVRIIGLPPQDINRMTFSTFVEWYLIRKAFEHDEVILNKPDDREQHFRMHDRIKGAFVYEPKPGFYKSIAVFDYRSLYPSIIASHNISRGVVNCACCKKGSTIETERGTFRYCAKRKGLFSEVIKNLILYRAEIKKELKKKYDPFLAARSDALKVLANSFYGYMGFAPARWYCIECAESTTAWARKYIQESINEAEKEGFRVLYSDTDSVFLLLDKKTKEDALGFVDKINRKLPELMELEYEGYYPAGIFVSLRASEAGAKKKYALIDEEGNITIKGFETVRRNWSFIAKEVQQKVLEIILKEHDAEKARQYVRSVVDDLKKNKIELDKMIIKTALSKKTEGYATIGPHVAAAKRLEERGETVGSGTIVRYIIVKGKGRIRDKVKLPDEAKQDEYDGEYYIQNQILPGVERIFAVLKIQVDDLVSSSSQKTLGNF